MKITEIEEIYFEYAFCMMDIAKSRKRKYNGYKEKPERFCFYTDAAGAERHEVFGGNPDRALSIKFGFQVDLSPDKHRELQANITPWAQVENAKWRAAYQRVYMDCREGDGMSEQEALQDWMNLIGRNYIEEMMPE
ncbi:MAG: hypothetical protein UC708_03465 [Anaerovoracaceae bacterium]|nr:hypothetical protein [Anaerovoracaceae bacterium]